MVMRRVVVLGGTGFFGGAAMERLRAAGLRPVAAGRRAGAELRLDADSRASLKTTLKTGDVVLDAAGPFQRRTTALVETAIEIGLDVVDLSDSLAYAERVAGLRLRIEAAGIRVFTSCSSLSAISAAAVARCGLPEPVRLSVFLRPATGRSAHGATAASLLESIGRPIRVRRDGRLVERRGWRERRRPHVGAPGGGTLGAHAPGGGRAGFLCEGPDALLLSASFPTLRQIDFWVDARVPGLNGVLGMAARYEPVRRLVWGFLPIGVALSRLAGPSSGALLYEIEGRAGSIATVILTAARGSHFAAVAPAVLATTALAQGKSPAPGLVPPERHVDAGLLFDELERLGIEVAVVRHGRPAA